ncbi:Wzz/FepE/Etk N-terminal domain-containing protein [Rothia sp. P7181]|uniref:Wzz/FepE/Etk N-terminal domain-containing protein n=1 Tax=unclassified Rothia (in: high G+C Gram-positive bacteria) TaxID=2689056 RepID=UPI003ACBAB21
MARNTSRRAVVDSPRANARAIRTVSLSAQLKKMVRHPMVIGVTVLVCVFIAGVFSLIATPKYEASATVLVNPLSTNPSSSSHGNVSINTEASVASSREVAEAAAKSLSSSHDDLVSELRQSIEVSAHSGTAIFDVKATASSAQDAAEYANAVAQAYLAVRSDALQDSVNTVAAGIEKQINALGKNGNDAARTALEERLAQVRITDTNAGRIITSAKVPQDSTNLGFIKCIFVGAVSGLLLGAIIAWVLDSRARTVNYRDRAEDILGEDVFVIRDTQDIEDTRRAFRSIGVINGDFRKANIAGAVLYSSVPRASDDFAATLRQAYADKGLTFVDSPASLLSQKKLSPSDTPNVLVTDRGTELSEVLSAADALGACVVVLTPETSVNDLEEFVSVAEHITDAHFLYVFLTS